MAANLFLVVSGEKMGFQRFVASFQKMDFNSAMDPTDRSTQIQLYLRGRRRAMARMAQAPMMKG